MLGAPGLKFTPSSHLMSPPHSHSAREQGADATHPGVALYRRGTGARVSRHMHREPRGRKPGVRSSDLDSSPVWTFPPSPSPSLHPSQPPPGSTSPSRNLHPSPGLRLWDEGGWHCPGSGVCPAPRWGKLARLRSPRGPLQDLCLTHTLSFAFHLPGT